MFKELGNLALKRTTQQAVGFYIVYLIGIALVAMVIAGGYAVVTGSDSYNLGVQIGSIVAIVACLGLSFQILKLKKLTGNTKLLMVAIGSAILAYLGGGLLGLIAVAYLTTR
ncbi:MAG: hypothetical protein ACEQSA_02350 [Weeksellaceae bacterium]